MQFKCISGAREKVPTHRGSGDHIPGVTRIASIGAPKHEEKILRLPSTRSGVLQGSLSGVVIAGAIAASLLVFSRAPGPIEAEAFAAYLDQQVESSATQIGEERPVVALIR